MKEYIINEELANAVLNYLAKQPWGEVNPLIQELNRMQPHDNDNTKRKPKSDKS